MSPLQRLINKLSFLNRPQVRRNVLLVIAAFFLNSIILFGFPIISYLKSINKSDQLKTRTTITLTEFKLEQKKKKKIKKLKLKQNKIKKNKPKPSNSRFKLKFGSGNGSGAGAVDKNMQNIIYSEGEVDSTPIRISGANPQAPSGSEGVKAMVELEITIDETGKVVSVKMIRSTGAYGFKENSINAVWKWKFIPAKIKNIPVKMRFLLPLNFK